MIKRTNPLAAALLALSTVPSFAAPLAPVAMPAGAKPLITRIDSRGWAERTGNRHHRRHHRAPQPGYDAPYAPGYGADQADSGGGYGGEYGGFHVNRYGYGNYTGGPEGFGGYPQGSGAGQEVRQEEEWKCEASPESC